MKTLRCKMQFLTPAFLGDAEQKGAWRTPPIKAQLRHFWRMVQASRGLTDVDTLRRAEADLFGTAAGDSGQKSLVRLRLDRWTCGQLPAWGQLASQRVAVGNNHVAASLYLGFGPLIYDKALKGPKLQYPPAIDANASAEVRIAVLPHQGAWDAVAQHDEDIRQALGLMHRFGTLGGRSRNGWGSYALESSDIEAPRRCLVNWEDAMEYAWPRGLGTDAGGPLLWQSARSLANWEDAMALLAGLRAQVNRCGADRTLLSYPITGQSRTGWNSQQRLPSSLRFKVRRTADKHYKAQIAHFPCRPNDELRTSGNVGEQALLDTWRKVHAFLDGCADLRRAAMEGDA